MKQLDELQGIRGLLALQIVLFHLGLNTIVSRATHGAIQESYWENAVDFFFVLSGYVLAHSQSVRHRPWRGFAISRAFRLLPAHIAVIALFFVALPKFGPLANSLSLIGAAFPLGLHQLNGVTWSMSAELYLPLILMPALLLVRSKRGAILALWILAVIADGVVVAAPSAQTVPGLLRGLFGIGTGYLTFYLSQHFRLRTAIFGCSSALAWFGGYLVVTLLSAKLAPLGALEPVFAVLAVTSAPTARSVLSSRPLVRLGDLTYCIYIIHYPIFRVFQAVRGDDAMHGAALDKIAIVALSIAGAELLSRLVEQPGIRLGKRLTRRRARSAEAALPVPAQV